jgi:ribose transport system ATP-binding protein
MMVGRELADLFPERGGSQGPIVLAVQDFRITERSRPFSLSVRGGEIVALAGLEGQGQQRFLRSLVGQFQPFAGQVAIKGKPLPLPLPVGGGVRRLLAMGVGFVPEDRKEDGLFLGLSVAHNIAAALYSRIPEIGIAPAYQRVVAETMASLGVKASSPSAAVGTLSGGNQQKVLLGRYLAAGLDILLVEEPTRGVDIGAKSEIYRLLRAFARKGGAVLVLSRETVELIGLCDRICVVHNDTIVREMPAAEATEHNILDAALSA